MKNYFEVKISCVTETEKKVTELYLVDAISFTEAEARIIEEKSPESVVSIKRASYSELFNTEAGDRYFNCKVEFVCLDEKSGKEKRTGVNILVYAMDIDDAKTFLRDGLKGTLSDYDVVAMKETKIIDVIQKNGKD